MRLALAQFAMDDEPEKNLVKVIQQLHEAAARSVGLVVFPKLCLSPFFPRSAGQDASRYAMRIDDECIQQLQAA